MELRTTISILSGDHPTANTLVISVFKSITNLTFMCGSANRIIDLDSGYVSIIPVFLSNVEYPIFKKPYSTKRITEKLLRDYYEEGLAEFKRQINISNLFKA